VTNNFSEMRKPTIAILADVPLSIVKKTDAGRLDGTGSTWLTQLVSCFETYADDFDFHWITLDKIQRRPEVFEVHRQHFHRIPSAKATVDLIMGHSIARLRLRSYLKRISPHLIHVWGTEGSYGCVLRDAQVPTLLSMQGILTSYARVGAFKDNWRATLQQYYERTWLPHATLISCESQWGIHEIQKIHPHACTEMIEYGVHPSFYETKWIPDPEKPRFIYIGTIDYRKGMDILLAALQQRSPKPFEMRMIGSGGYQSAFQNIPRVRLLGNLPWSAIQKELAQAWALVLPTRADTSPNVVKEARVVGLPVITTLYGGQSGYIQHQENGWIIEPLTSVKLAEAIRALTQNFDLVKKLGATHHQRDREYFKPEKTAQRFIEIYRRMLASFK
jgi:glycosyltransferase involved in cell wall biosynthesis